MGPALHYPSLENALHYPSLEKGEEEEEKSEQWRANVVARVVGKYRLTCGMRPYIKSHAQLSVLG